MLTLFPVLLVSAAAPGSATFPAERRLSGSSGVSPHQPAASVQAWIRIQG